MLELLLDFYEVKRSQRLLLAAIENKRLEGPIEVSRKQRRLFKLNSGVFDLVRNNSVHYKR